MLKKELEAVLKYCIRSTENGTRPFILVGILLMGANFIPMIIFRPQYYSLGVVSVLFSGIVLFFYLIVKKGLPLRFIDKYWVQILAVLGFFYFIIFSSLSIIQFENYNGGDAIATFANCLWNTMHGKFMYSDIVGENHFNLHFSPIFMFFFIFYSVFKSPIVLLILQVLSITVSIIPLTLITRIYFQNYKAMSVLFALLFLFFPGIIANAFNGFHEVVFFPAFFLFALFFFLRESFIGFIIFFICCLCIQETILFAVVWFIFFGFLKKRTRRWIVIPALLIMLNFIMATTSIFRYLGSDYYLYLIGEQKVESVIYDFKIKQKIVYLYTLFSPVGFVFFTGSFFVFGILDLFKNILATVDVAFISRHHASVGSAAILLGCLQFISFLYKRFNLKSFHLPVMLAFVVLSSFPYWSKIVRLSDPYKKTKDKIVELIKQESGVSVIAPEGITQHLSNRDFLLNIVFNSRQWEDVDFVVLDLNMRIPEKWRVVSTSQEEIYKSIKNNSKYKLLLDENNHFIFKRTIPLVESDMVVDIPCQI